MDDQLEDGEILDDDDHTTIAQPTTSTEFKESDIDRIIEETKFKTIEGKPINITKLILKHAPGELPVVEDPDLRALRLAALGTLGKTVKEKVDKSSIPSMPSYSRKRSRDLDNELSFSKSRLSKYRSTSSKTLSSRDRERSSRSDSLREKDKERERDPQKSSKNVPVVKSSKEATSKNSDKEDPRASRGRLNADMVLGEENKEIPSMSKLSSPSSHVEDNYDNVGMDIDSNCSESELNGRRVEEDVASALPYDVAKNSEIETVRSKTCARIDSPPVLSTDISRDQYRIKYDNLQHLDKAIRSRIDEIEEAHERKNKIMKELEHISKSLEEYKHDYEKAIRDRDNLRKEISDYEEQKIKRLLFGEEEMKLKEERVSRITTPEQIRPEVEASAPSSVTKENILEESMLTEKATSETSSVHDEERLRRNLLEKLKSMQAAKEKERLNNSAEDTTHQNEEIATNDHLSPRRFNESADDEISNNSSFASMRDSLEPTPVPREMNYGMNSALYPPRFLNHLGGNERNHSTAACPYEMMGRCKDFACSYLHFRDEELDVRDLVLMFIQYKNIGHHDIRKKIDEIVEQKKRDETGFQFFVRLLHGKSKNY